jgi:lipopolysaccharide/colanic/teichoic acid biosynthesis glycosyltransferase
VGRGGRLFELIKFRTMVRDAEAEGPRWATAGDKRITRVGRADRCAREAPLRLPDVLAAEEGQKGLTIV